MLSFGVISHGIAAAGFLLLTLLLAVGWEGRGQGVRLIVACAMNAAWAGMLAYFAWAQRMPLAPLTAALFRETVLEPLLWLGYLFASHLGTVKARLHDAETIGFLLLAGIGGAWTAVRKRTGPRLVLERRRPGPA